VTVAKAKRKPKQDAQKETVVDIVSEMEEGVQALLDCGHLVARLAQTLEAEESGMFAQVGWQIIARAEA
jgi:hypothetical protein